MAAPSDVTARRAAVAFALGSLCFLIAPIPVFSAAVGIVAVNAVFFVGSLFFTAGGVLQQLSVGWGLAAADDRRSWWSSAVQLLGTLFFNLSTAVALAGAVSAGAHGGTGWRPDAYGSVCFLVSSFLGVVVVWAAYGAWAPAARPWLEGWLGFAGSILFAISAVGAYIRPATGAPVDLFWADAGTAAGAACFLAAALLGLRRS